MNYQIARGQLLLAQLEGMQGGGVLEKVMEGIERAERDVLVHPHLAEHMRHKLRSPLDSAHRFKVGRFRLFYVVAPELGRVTVLYAGFRREGDRKDAYVQFEKSLRAGHFDAEYRALGLTHPFMT